LAIASLVIGIACALGAVVNMIIDYALHGFLGAMSLINLASSAAGWMLIGYPMLSYRRPALFLPVMAAVAVAYLWALERLTGGGGWFLSLALPISVSGIAIGALTAWACWRAKRHGPNIAALILLGGTAACMAIESILSLGSSGALRLGWSAIVAVAAVPTAVLLFSLNARLRRRGVPAES